MYRFSIGFWFFILLLSSCVPNKKLLYFQKDDLKKKHPTDSILRSYSLHDFEYKIQTNDLISVRYQTLTTEVFDFLGDKAQSISGSTTTAAGGGGSMGGGGGVNILLMGDLVDNKGEIPMPVVGKVKVAGLTIFQIQDTIQKIANKYLEGPTVRVRLLNYRATILGEVLAEGHIVFNNNRVSLPEAIGMAGGLGELADRTRVKIIRQQGAKAEVNYVNLLKEDFIHSPFYYVHQNDVIVVPPLRQRPFRKYFTQNVSIIVASISLLLVIISLTKK
jgi:polysaccharide export outer membrane protein